MTEPHDHPANEEHGQTGANLDHLAGGGDGGQPASLNHLTETGEVFARGPASTLEFQPKPVPTARGLAALRHRNFLLFWSGQLVSLIGTWMQSIAQVWLVLELTNSPLALGVVTTLQFLPTLLLSLFGGVIADRLPRRSILVATQSSAMLLAFILGILTSTGLVHYVHVLILAAAFGLVNAVDMPTRQAFVVDLVPPEILPNAIALNSSIFNAARLVGPALAGIVIGIVGVGAAFYLNALSFLPVIGALLLINVTYAGTHLHATSVWANLKEGVDYVVHTPLIRFVVTFVGVVSAFAMNFSILIPILARDKLHVGASGFGLLMSALGLGSLVGALLLATVRWHPRPRLLILSAAAFGIFEAALAILGTFVLSSILLFFAGLAMVTFTTLANTALQTAVPDALRGRVMSVYTTVFIGVTPIASPLVGAVTEVLGVNIPLAIGGLAAILAAAVSSWWRPWESHSE